MRLQALLISLAMLVGCSNPASEPAGASTIWDSHCDAIVPGEIEACYGPVRTAGSVAYDKYEVDVESLGSSSRDVLYKNIFPASQVASHLISREPHAVVYYNSSTRMIKFELGGPEASFRLH